MLKRLRPLLLVALLPAALAGDAQGDLLPDHEAYSHGGGACPYGWTCTQRLGSVRLKHADVTSVAWNPAGGTLASGSVDRSFAVWNVRDGSARLVRRAPFSPGSSPYRFHLSSAISAVAWSPDGKRLVTGSDDPRAPLRLWDCILDWESRTLEIAWSRKTGKQVKINRFYPDLEDFDPSKGEVAHFAEHYAPVSCLAWAPGGGSVLEGSTDGFLRAWDPAGNREIRKWKGHEGTVHAVAFSPDGSRLASGGADRALRIWNPATGDRILEIPGFPNWVTSVSWSPDGKALMSGCQDGSLQVWDAASGKPSASLEKHPGSVLGVAWSPDGRRLASAGADATARSRRKDSAIRIWDAATFRELRQLKGHSREVASLSWSPDGRRLASGSGDGTCRIWDVETGKEDPAFEGHREAVLDLAWSPDGGRILTAGPDRVPRIWDVRTGRVLRKLEGHQSGVLSACWSPDGRRIATASEDNTLRTWESGTGAPLLNILEERCVITAVSWSPDGRRLASGGEDSRIHLWDADTGNALGIREGHAGFITGLAWSPDGRRLASCSRDGTARIWDPDGKGDPLVLRGHRGPVTTVSWSRDGKAVLTGGWDGSMKLWNPSDGTVLRKFGKPRGLVEITAPGRNGKPATRTRVDYKALVCSAGLDAKGSRIVSGDEGGLAPFWEEGKEEYQDLLLGHEAAVRVIAWSPDGRGVATAGDDGTVLVWSR